jgi:hypothetical protein
MAGSPTLNSFEHDAHEAAKRNVINSPIRAVYPPPATANVQDQRE